MRTPLGFLVVSHLFEVVYSQWEPLKIGVIYDEQQIQLSPFIKNSLWDSIEWMESAITVSPVSSDSKVIKLDCLSQCTESRLSPGIKLHTLRRTLNITEGAIVTEANFLVMLQINAKDCFKDQFLLAAAAPCFKGFTRTERSPLSVMVVCPRSKAWLGFPSGQDLFKHEFMHGLGFGMLNPDQEPKKSPKSEPISWRLSPRRSTTHTIHYLDFAQSAKDFASEHFSCPDLNGIQAENKDKMHLDEYIYGNELMTPVLSRGPNYFTSISASILENTFIGDRPWYKTNKDIVRREDGFYWYGKGVGCGFLTKSCFDFVSNGNGHQSPIRFPLCSEKEIRKSLRREPLSICFKNSTHTFRTESTCHIQSLGPGPKDDKMVTLKEMFPKSIRASRTPMFGSSSVYRYCPMITQVIDGRLDIPFDGIQIPCS